MQSYDVICIGGSVMGCATAYHLLKRDSTLMVAIIERDPTYEKASTTLSDGNIRIQFNTKENILISQYGMKALATFADDMAVGDEKPDIQFHQEGNLFLSDEGGRESAIDGMKLQQSMGCTVEWLEPSEVQEHYPFINPSTIAGGTFGVNDGTMDPYAVLIAYKNKVVDLGADFIVAEVASVNVDKGQAHGVTLADGQSLSANHVVNCAGAWGVAIAKQIGIDLPIAPTMRHVFHIETPVSSDTRLPLIIFPSGIYLHHENSNHFAVGKSLSVDPIGFDFTVKRQLFLDYFWEDMAHYCPEMEHLKLIDGWTGLYAINTFDGNAIVGESPQVNGFFLAQGFSGHGFQQCHAVGSYLADEILHRQPVIDLSAFSQARILNNQPIHESAHRLI